MDEHIETLNDAAFGASTEAIPKYISPVDPATRWTGADGGGAYVAYSTNYLVDLDNAVIVDVEPTAPIRPAEARAAREMIDRGKDRFGIKPDKLVGYSSSRSAEMLGWLLEDRKIAPHIPVWDKSKRTDDAFSRQDFDYDPAADNDTRPTGNTLEKSRRKFSKPQSANVIKDGLIRYRSRKQDCDTCPMRMQCCPTQPARIGLRSVHEAA